MWKKIIILALICVPSITNASLGDGLVLYMPLDKRDNSWAGLGTEDRSIYKNKGRISGTTQASAEVTAKRFEGLLLDGANDQVRVTHSANYVVGSGDFSVAFWVNRRALSLAYDNIWAVTKWSGGTAATNEWYTGFTTDGANEWPVFGIRSAAGSQYAVSINSDTTTNVWYHYVAVREGVDMRIYLDGVLGVSTAALPADTSVNNASTDILVGASIGASLWTNAVYDDVRVYNRALSSSDVRDLYWNGRTRNYWGKIKNYF
jgi:hypothetical protein